jgi:serine/threonine-protein kinase
MKPDETQKLGSRATASRIGGFESAASVSHVRPLAATIPDTGTKTLATHFDGAAPRSESASVRGRTTVLPARHLDATAVGEAEPRFHHVRALGEGAMGQVDLVRDNDIHRTVALKRILKGTESADALLRFAEEIRIVGQLEHRGIVPIYDVGRDDDGEVYLVMKHLQGETMEQIIDRLKAGDPVCRELYTPEYRARLFLGVLEAMGYAHARGLLHRDIKPANVMIGPYGEVTVLDWGIARPISKRSRSQSSEPFAPTFIEPTGRLIESRAGAIAGTPLYMSPEQAAASDDLDERSDVYALCVLFYEWLTLRHPLADKKTVSEVLATLVLRDYDPDELVAPAQRAGVPMEYVWIILPGLARDREKRYASVTELETALRRALDGKIQVHCQVTRTKNRAHRFLKWIDRHAKLYMTTLRAVRFLMVLALGAAIVLAFSKLRP